MSTTLRAAPYTQSNITVTVASTAVLAATNLKYLMLVNTSTTVGQIIWVALDGGAAVVGEGIPLMPNFGSLELLMPPTGAIYAISAAGSPVLSVTWA